MQVAVLMGTVVMLISSCLLLLGRNQLGRLFSSELDVVMLTAQAVPPLAVSLIGECTQPIYILSHACQCSAAVVCCVVCVLCVDVWAAVQQRAGCGDGEGTGSATTRSVEER
jgi:hypothetical protein